MKNIFLKTSLLITVFAVLISCAEGDDFTGASTQTATSPALSVELGFANEQTLIEEESAYKFTVSISEKQIVDISVKLTQTGGTAVRGLNFDFPSSVTIKKGTTSTSDFITILVDPRANPPVDAIIEIVTGVEANVGASNSETVKFNILNLVEGDLAVGLEWAASNPPITDNFGNEIGPTELADLRLLLTDVPYTTILDEADGGSFEMLTIDADTPDGEYYMVTDFFAAYDIDTDLDVRVTFDQIGVIDGLTYDFTNALNTTETCPEAYFVMAKVIKTGINYEIEPVGEKNQIDLNDYVGTWSGQGSWFEHFGYTSDLVTTIDANGDLWITGIAFQWFEGWWGENILEFVSVKMDVNLQTGEFTIPNQYYLTTDWDGGTPYNVTATGKLSGLCSEDHIIELYPIFDIDGETIEGEDFGGVPFKELATLDE